MFLNNEWQKNEIKDEIRKFLETNEIELKTVHNLRKRAKEFLRGKFIVIQAYLKKDRNISCKQPDPISTRIGGTTTKTRASRRKEITKIRGE